MALSNIIPGLWIPFLASGFALGAGAPALAADNIFGGASPLTQFVDFVVGPMAYAVVIVALVITVGTLALGGEFSGFARRMPIVVIAGGIVILADTVIGNLFGGARAFTVPDHWEVTVPLPDGALPGSVPNSAGPPEGS